jgi:redox-sensitive bicupin YhaK (pirin superfamily)
MKTELHTAASRGHVKFDWLDTYHYFSFGQYHNPARVHFGALRVINDDHIDAGMGFGKHPHDNMEIVTIPL